MSRYSCFYRGIPAAVRICCTCNNDLACEGLEECHGCTQRRLRREMAALSASRAQAGRFWESLPRECAPAGSAARARTRRPAEWWCGLAFALGAAGLLLKMLLAMMR